MLCMLRYVRIYDIVVCLYCIAIVVAIAILIVITTAITCNCIALACMYSSPFMVHARVERRLGVGNPFPWRNPNFARRLLCASSREPRSVLLRVWKPWATSVNHGHGERWEMRCKPGAWNVSPEVEIF